MVHYRRCSFQGCSSYSSAKKKDMHLYSYPADEERRKLWVENSSNPDIQNASWADLQSKYVCELHFEASMFHDARKNKVIRVAVPNKFVPPQVQENAPQQQAQSQSALGESAVFNHVNIVDEGGHHGEVMPAGGASPVAASLGREEAAHNVNITPKTHRTSSNRVLSCFLGGASPGGNERALLEMETPQDPQVTPHRGGSSTWVRFELFLEPGSYEMTLRKTGPEGALRAPYTTTLVAI